MNVFIFCCVVFCTMAAVVVLIDRFVKQPEVSVNLRSAPTEQRNDQSSMLCEPVTDLKNCQLTNKKCVAGINELSPKKLDQKYFLMTAGGEGYASSFVAHSIVFEDV